MSLRRSARGVTAVCVFGAAAASFAVGLGGRSGSWIVAMLVSLVLLTIGFFIRSGSDRSNRSDR